MCEYVSIDGESAWAGWGIASAIGFFTVTRARKPATRERKKIERETESGEGRVSQARLGEEVRRSMYKPGVFLNKNF